MEQKIVFDLVLLLLAWLISPLVWVALVLIPAILRNPTEFLLNQEGFERAVLVALLRDKVFWKVFPVLVFPYAAIVWVLEVLRLKQKSQPLSEAEEEELLAEIERESEDAENGKR